MSAISSFQKKAPIYMVLLMQDFGFSPDDAAAIMGNFGHESGGLTILQEKRPTVRGSRGGYGWAQWTASRRVDYEAYCKRNNLDPASDKANYAFVFVELKGSERGAVAKTKAAVGLENKVIAFERAFERAGVKHYASRLTWAKRAKAAWEAAGRPMPVTPVTPKVPPTPDVIKDVVIIGGGAAGAATYVGFHWPTAIIVILVPLIFYLLWRYRSAVGVLLQKLKPPGQVVEAIPSSDLQKRKAELLKSLETRFDVTGSITSMTRAELEMLKAANLEKEN